VAIVAAVLLGAALAAGCSTTAGIEAAGKKSWNQDGAPELSKQVVINNSSLAGDVEIVDLKNSDAGNLMKAQVSLRSKSRDTVQVQYKFDWFDSQGMELASNAAWKPLLIYGKETQTVQAVAPDPRAHEFRLKLREPEQD